MTRRGTIPERIAAWSSAHTLLADVLLVLPLLVLLVVTSGPWGTGSLPAVVFWTDAAAVSGLALRRRLPVASMLVVGLAATAYLVVVRAVGHPTVFGLTPIAALASFYAVSAYASRPARRVAIPWMTLGAVSFALLVTTAGPVPAGGAPAGATPVEKVIVALMFLAVAFGVWALGALRRARLREVAGLQERARLLEAERLHESRLAALSERTRIAREMHDIVAHSLTSIILQADGGRYAAAADPDRAVDALAAIGDLGRRSLTDMRSLLGVLREDDGRERRSTPSVQDLPELVEEARRTGRVVEFAEAGTPGGVGSGPGLTVYRVVQEALTNALRHAGDGPVRLALAWAPAEILVEVTNALRVPLGAGSGSEPEGPGGREGVVREGAGRGITGMRERVELHGGTLTAGPIGGRFVVRLRLPLAPESARGRPVRRGPGESHTDGEETG